MKAICDKSPDKKHQWVNIARPVQEGLIYYHVCKHCKTPSPYDFKHNGQFFGKDEELDLEGINDWKEEEDTPEIETGQRYQATRAG